MSEILLQIIHLSVLLMTFKTIKVHSFNIISRITPDTVSILPDVRNTSHNLSIFIWSLLKGELVENLSQQNKHMRGPWSGFSLNFYSSPPPDPWHILPGRCQTQDITSFPVNDLAGAAVWHFGNKWQLLFPPTTSRSSTTWQRTGLIRQVWLSMLSVPS